MKQLARQLIVTIITWQATMLLKKHKPTIIAIAGSVGKTTTKDAIYAAIKGSITARKSERSLNSDIGVPLTVLGLSNAHKNPILWTKNIVDGLLAVLFQKKYPKVLVLETGIDRPGDMSALTKWLKPHVAVLTRLPEVPVHVEFFDSPEAVIAEKMKLVSALSSDGTLIYNHDDMTIQELLPTVRQKRVGYSRYLASDFNTSNDRIVYEDNIPAALEFTASHGSESYQVRLNGVVGTQQVYACSAALAVAFELGIALKDAVAGLQQLSVARGRMRIIPGLKSSVLIDDTYNSSPAAVESALETLQELKFAKRKIAVLGDMLELGKHASEQHRRIGELAAGIADLLIVVGVRSRKTVEGALTAGMDEANILQYDDALRAGKELQNLLEPGDFVLVKASQGIRAERIVEEVMAEPQRAEALLARQDKGWR